MSEAWRRMYERHRKAHLYDGIRVQRAVLLGFIVGFVAGLVWQEVSGRVE